MLAQMDSTANLMVKHMKRMANIQHNKEVLENYLLLLLTIEKLVLWNSREVNILLDSHLTEMNNMYLGLSYMDHIKFLLEMLFTHLNGNQNYQNNHQLDQKLTKIN